MNNNMSRRYFLQWLLTISKSIFLVSCVQPSHMATAREADTGGALHYKPLNGKSLRELALQKIHHGNGRYLNPVGVPRNGRFWQLMSWKLFSPNHFKDYLDDQPVTPVSMDWSPISTHPGVSITYLKHSSVIIKDGASSLIVDPVFSDIFWFIKDFTPLDFIPRDILSPDHILITHGHYDHLDKPSLEKFNKNNHVITPLGYNEEFKDLGMKNRLQMDWYDRTQTRSFEITLLPCNHWTMRSPVEGPNRSLWGAYLIRTRSGYTIYVSSDSAYFDGFQEIASDYKIDLAIINLGAYEPRWFMAPSHMNPKETVQAFKELGAAKLMIVHWGTFRLGDEPVHFPPKEIKRELQKENLGHKLVDIKHGETYYPG